MATTLQQHTTSLALAPVAADRFPAPTGSGPWRSTLVLAIGPFRDWLQEQMTANEMTAVDSRQPDRS